MIDKASSHYDGGRNLLQRHVELHSSSCQQRFGSSRRIYRAYATYNNPLAITSPGPCGPGTPTVDPGSNVPITVDASKFPNWKKLEFYDGAKKLGTFTAVPSQFTAMNLAPGYHEFSVLGTDAGGEIQSSNPAMVVVRTPPMEVSGTQP